PESEQDVDMSCTCPDWANPCKHIAAVFYVLGVEFNRDPFLLLLLRGMSKERVLAALREKRAQISIVSKADSASSADQVQKSGTESRG
ncbi:MAG TPA: hypothetical protein DCL63_05275, partial [Firmicutes bacterium]|nr:hypothetical protein [Bacillota bacterium]